jgi:ParB family transcriptional regulator, chromosome partitioning protein
MAKKRPAINLARPTDAHSGDLAKLFTAGEDVERSAGLQLLAIRLDAIRPDPNQPRQSFDDDSLADLSESIRQDGVIQPIEVVEVEPHRYMLVHGERRWRAAQLAGLETIPAIVRRRDYDDLTRFVRQLVENLQREDLNDVDRANGLVHLKQLMETEAAGQVSNRKTWKNKVTWPQVGERIGYSKQRINQLVQLLKLPPDIQEDVRAGRISERDTRVYHKVQPEQQPVLHQARKTGQISQAELSQAARLLQENPTADPQAILEQVRRGEPSKEPSFDSSFKGRPFRFPGGNDPLFRANAGRIEQARVQLAALEWEGLNTAGRQQLAALLHELRQEVEAIIEALSH